MYANPSANGTTIPATATSNALRPTRIKSRWAGLKPGVEQNENRANFRDGVDCVTGMDPSERIRAQSHTRQNLSQHGWQLHALKDFADDFGREEDGK